MVCGPLKQDVGLSLVGTQRGLIQNQRFVGCVNSATESVVDSTTSQTGRIGNHSDAPQSGLGV